MCDFFANYRALDTSNIIDIHEYLIEKQCKIMFIKKMFVKLLTGIVSASYYTKCVSLSNQKCMTQPAFINLHPNEYSHFRMLLLSICS